MSELVKCEECGSDTEARVEGSTSGIFCTKCDWAVVTSYITEIELDETNYKIYLLSADLGNKEHVKKISEIANVNYIQTRKLMMGNRELIMEGRASSVGQAKNALDEQSIQYEIEPKFPY